MAQCIYSLSRLVYIQKGVLQIRMVFVPCYFFIFLYLAFVILLSILVSPKESYVHSLVQHTYVEQREDLCDLFHAKTHSFTQRRKYLSSIIFFCLLLNFSLRSWLNFLYVFVLNFPLPLCA